MIILDAYQDERDERTRQEECNKVTGFWDRHIPFLVSCRNGYCYFAICLLPNTNGQVVFGVEPEFEDTEIVADSFSDFMSRLVTGTLDKKFLGPII